MQQEFNPSFVEQIEGATNLNTSGSNGTTKPVCSEGEIAPPDLYEALQELSEGTGHHRLAGAVV